jgi:hypothetical protein
LFDIGDGVLPIRTEVDLFGNRPIRFDFIGLTEDESGRLEYALLNPKYDFPKRLRNTHSFPPLTDGNKAAQLVEEWIS